MHHISRHFHCQWMIHTFIAAEEAHNAPTPAALEAIDAGHSLFFRVAFRNAPEIVAACTVLPGLANGLPLQQVVGHYLPLLVARSAIEIDGLPGEQSHK